MTSKPKILLAATSAYYPAARLVMALAAAGCEVDAVCPVSHPLRKTKAIRQTHVYRGLAPLRSFARAITGSRPDLLVSADDLATEHLHSLHAREQKRGSGNSPLRALIERSLGEAGMFPAVRERASFMASARRAGVRVPGTQAVRNIDELRAWIGDKGVPAVLKADGTSGGDGVRVVQTLEQAEKAFQKLQAPPLLARAVKRALLDDDRTLVWPSLLRRRNVVNAQALIRGSEATSTVFCWKGEVRASLHCEVIHKASSTGHATVVRVMEQAEMSAAVEAMARCLGLSGFHGFDFILEAQTGHAYLIEINPRATQVGHLALGSGHDLPAALFAALSDKAPQPGPKVTDKTEIALFPQEWIRDPESDLLQTAYHDVPWEEPALIQDCVDNRRKQSAWYSRRNPAIFPAHPAEPAAALKGHAAGLHWSQK